MVNINGSNPLDVGSIPATPAIKLKKRAKIFGYLNKKQYLCTRNWKQANIELRSVIKIVANWWAGEETVEEKGYEPYESVIS